MATVTKITKKSLIELSRIAVECDVTHYDNGSAAVADRDECVKIGSLQRIANSVENIAKNLAVLQEKQPDHNSYKLMKQVTKLSARLKKAGLDGDPNSDNRGRPTNGSKTS